MAGTLRTWLGSTSLLWACGQGLWCVLGWGFQNEGLATKLLHPGTCAPQSSRERLQHLLCPSSELLAPLPQLLAMGGQPSRGGAAHPGSGVGSGKGAGGWPSPRPWLLLFLSLSCREESFRPEVELWLWGSIGRQERQVRQGEVAGWAVLSWDLASLC